MTHRLDLEIAVPKEGDLPGPAISRIRVKNLLGHKFISPACVSLPEIEHAIDQLHKELEILRTKAKKLYNKKS